MQIELANISKYRTGNRLGDDVPLVMPGQVFGVFDGATDPRGTVVDGMGTGRLAALAAAAHVASLATSGALVSMASEEIVRSVAKAMAQRSDPLGLPIPPSTTLAIAIDCQDSWRFLLLGDSGIRLNGTETYRHEKRIDRVSTSARVAIFKVLRDRLDDLDAVEMAKRR